MALQFEWDATKAKANLAKHDVSSEEAATVFGDSASLTINDPDHSQSEVRFITIGKSHTAKVLVWCILIVATISESSALAALAEKNEGL
jgi:uncharacterized DUF497 family protein